MASAMFCNSCWVIYPILYAISSIHAINRPCRFCIVPTKLDASSNPSYVPVSSQANPLPKSCTRNFPFLRYSLSKSVISISPLGDNVFFGQGFRPILSEASSLKEGAVIFGYYVNNPK